MQQPPDVTSVTSAVSSAASAPSREEDSASITSDNSGPIKTLLQNLLGGNNNDKSREEMERERKWSEWMAFGRKVQESNGGSDSTSTSDVSLDESLLSVEKGADYVVVAVPAEAADGVGPILSSFPGGKLFQKTIGKTFQEKGRRTISNQQQQQQQKEDIAQKQKLRQQKHYREHQRMRDLGRISAMDWRHNILNLPSSTILRDVRSPVAWVFAWATLWSVFHKWLMRVTTTSALLSEQARWMGTAAWFARHMCLPTVQHTMMVSSISLLLVFRTNSSYQRFAEGR